jgi:hypothetical protein
MRVKYVSLRSKLDALLNEDSNTKTDEDVMMGCKSRARSAFAKTSSCQITLRSFILFSVTKAQLILITLSLSPSLSYSLYTLSFSLPVYRSLVLSPSLSFSLSLFLPPSLYINSTYHGFQHVPTFTNYIPSILLKWYWYCWSAVR